MIKNIVIGIILFIIGVKVGQKVKSREMDQREVRLNALAIALKNTNNKMVDTIAKFYEANCDDPSVVSDIDMMLMDMWID